jgi:phage baseplate assembly protein gpV
MVYLLSGQCGLPFNFFINNAVFISVDDLFTEWMMWIVFLFLYKQCCFISVDDIFTEWTMWIAF